MEKIPSGIDGFDKLLYGGFPKGRSVLISGEPGTGKTLFTLQFLLAGLKQGETCMFITIDEKPEHILLDAQQMEWDLSPYLNSGKLHILDVTKYFALNDDHSTIDVEKIISDILGYVKKNKATRLAIDPVAPLIFAEQTKAAVIDYIRKLIFAIEEYSDCTTLLTSYVPVGSDKVSHHGIEEFAASGIVLLRLVKHDNKYIRTIRVRKLRGSRIDLSEYNFDILPQRGFVLRNPI